MNEAITASQRGVVVQLMGGNATVILNDTIIDTACEFVRPKHISTYNELVAYLKHPVLIGTVVTYHSGTTNATELGVISGFMNEAVLIDTANNRGKAIPWTLVISVIFPHRKIT